jgi:hypothetical protein
VLGFVMYEGPSLIGQGDIAVIATLKCANAKTGDMVQVWIMPKDVDTLEAVQKGDNAAACGDCPLMGTPYKVSIKRRGGVVEEVVRLQNRVCYANLGRLDSTVGKAYRRGRYAPYNRRIHERFLRGRNIRLGAYGDPAAMPDSLLEYLASVGSGHTGYSHQLFSIDRERADRLARLLMVSCHTPAQHNEAVRRGWRPFTVIAEGQAPPRGAVECPFYTHSVQCETCLLCQGSSKRAKPVFVRAHAMVGTNLPIIQEQEHGKALAGSAS